MTRGAAAVLLLLLPLVACGGGDDGGQGRELTVLAAASLTDTFTALAEQFEADNPGVEVTLAFDSSTTLATQVVDGAPGDVLATADDLSMGVVTDADAAAADPTLFATNTLVLVVPSGNPAGVDSLDDLAGDVDWVMCDPSVPCGKVAQSNLDESGVDAEPASFEVDVRAVLAKVTSDEADAGLVYATDAVAAGDTVESFAIDGADAFRNDYYVVPVTDGDLAAAFVALVAGADGRAVLTEAGFGAP